MRTDEVEFPAPIVITTGFHQPIIPLRPAVRARSLCFAAHRRPSLESKRTQAITVSGRAALALFARARQLSHRSRILMPSYHCPSMVAPFLMCGADVEFYSITKALEPDRESLARLLSERTDAVVFPNYFGVKPIPEDCVESARSVGATVVHDLAHAYRDLQHVPKHDYAIASLPKFFPIDEGGLLMFPEGVNNSRRELSEAPRSVDELRAGWRMVSRAWRQSCGARWRSGVKATTPTSLDSHSSELRVGEAKRSEAVFDMKSTGKRICRVSAWAWSFSNVQRIFERRRDNYRHYLRLFANGLSEKVIVPVLAENAAPYVFPFLLSDGESEYAAIRRRGVPMYRWEEMISIGDEVVEGFRKRLVQLPCHQDLSKAQIELIAMVVRETVGMR